MSVRVCNWKYGKQWVYSITYDEALADLHRFAVPLHEAFGIPGHVEAVASQIGQVRRLGNSSYNGFRHMSGEEMRDLLARGWGVGNHSWSHEVITPETVDRELRRAKEFCIGQLGLALEDTMDHMLWIGEPTLHLDKTYNLKDVLKGINSVSACDIKRLARDIFKPEAMRLAVVGPEKNEDKLYARIRNI